MHIVDRRLNPGGRSHRNRQLFDRRKRAATENAIAEILGKKSAPDLGKINKDTSVEVTIPGATIHEPTFHRAARGGRRDYVLPGNPRDEKHISGYIVGDTMPRPPGGGGRGAQGSPDGEGKDDFHFRMTGDEFLDFILDMLELPNAMRKDLADMQHPTWHRAGYAVTGNPSNLALMRTVRNSLSRRIALKRPKPDEVQALRDAAEAFAPDDESPEAVAARDVLARALRKTGLIPYIDPLDVRFKRFDPQPRPKFRAAMFCLMDVSGSMTEDMKTRAKLFFGLMELFLRRKYPEVDVIYIRHTHNASEVDRDTFFHSPETGGTIVSSALLEMEKIIQERYPADSWNIYGAQASDGDNTESDNKLAADVLGRLLPQSRYFAYVETPGASAVRYGVSRETDIWKTYKAIVDLFPGVLAMRKVGKMTDIAPVFADLFRRRDGAPVAAFRPAGAMPG